MMSALMMGKKSFMNIFNALETQFSDHFLGDSKSQQRDIFDKAEKYIKKKIKQFFTKIVKKFLKKILKIVEFAIIKFVKKIFRKIDKLLK